MALKFFYNGIKDNGGPLQLCTYSNGALLHHPEGTITIYARSYKSFSAAIRQAFGEVENNTDLMTDYFEEDRIRVLPTHPLYPQVKAACDLRAARMAKRYRKAGVDPYGNAIA